MSKIIINANTVKKAKSDAQTLGKDVWVLEAGARGEGRLRLRAFPHGGVAFYYRYSLKGVQKQIRLESTDPTAARAEAADLAALYRAGNTDLHGYLAGVALVEDLKAKAEAAKLQREKTEREIAELERARQGTLAQLLEGYVADLERRGKVSAKDVRGAFRIDVLGAFPALAATPAKAITPYDIRDVIGHCLTRPVANKGRGARLTQASASNGKKRQADKLRSYLRAAFTYGLHHDLSAQRHTESVQFGLTVNPVQDVPTIEGANRALTWALTKDELRAVLLAVEDLPERRRSIAKAMLYLAGQRVEMLCRVKWDDLFTDGEHGEVMQLLDLKGGKGSPPRVHLLPVTERLHSIMAPLLALQGGEAPGPFTLRGRKAIGAVTAQKIFAELGDQLAAAGKSRRFSWRNIRATVETHLAALGVTEERRAWLLSHGRSGVQAKHYDRYSYLPEKRADLDKWARYLDQLATGEAAVVVQLHRGGV